jgi:uncharacterized protein (DUF608 family)
MRRREFLKLSSTAAAATSLGAAGSTSFAAEHGPHETRVAKRAEHYEGAHLDRIAFPMGGMGAGMICLEGTGALSHFSLRNHADVFNEPATFAAVFIKGKTNVARVLEGPVPNWKKFGAPGSANGEGSKTFGLPRFREARFSVRFPFATVALADETLPITAEITGWSPFEPGDADNASLPVVGLEYRLTNKTGKEVEGVFSWSARNFMIEGRNANAVKSAPGGFTLWSGAPKERGWEEGAFLATVDSSDVKVNHAWFRGAWFDPLTIAWEEVEAGKCFDHAPVTEGDPSPGATLFVPFTLPPRESKTIVLRLAWHVGQTNLRIGKDPEKLDQGQGNYKPWYAERFANIGAVTDYWREHYDELRTKTRRFTDCFYNSTLPPEVIEAVAANLTILKSPTVMRQADGRLWAWEGCNDNSGCCYGSCTHVWNYAQALPHLFPSLERTLRETEFGPSQDERGHQQFRTSLPIRPAVHDFHAAADGQLGGIMKIYRDWRISGDTEWLRQLWPKVKSSLNYCIELWDPAHKGWVEEPHHNTYDIEFWGPDGMCTSFYLGALKAATLMGKTLGDDSANYEELLQRGLQRMENELYDGEYFFQKVEWKNLRAKPPQGGLPEVAALLEQEGPKYQYGRGCLSDGVLGAWMAEVCGVGQVLDSKKVASHLNAVHKYNLKSDLTAHANPQRPTYACGDEGGLLLCTWPKGGKLSLPFVYSNEVWTGIEYQVASHLILLGHVESGLEIVRTVRSRYDGTVRNPFDEYECGHWYARAMSSYALLQALSGARYDAVEKILHLEPKIKGDFRAFISTATGYGHVGVKRGKPFVEVAAGKIEIKEIVYL